MIIVWVTQLYRNKLCLIQKLQIFKTIPLFPTNNVPSDTSPLTIHLSTENLLDSKVKVNWTIVEALRLCTGRTAHRGSRGIALPFLDHGTRRGWVVSVTPQPLFTLGKDPVSIVQEAGWATGPVWTGAENLAPPAFDPRTVQPVASRNADYATRPTCSTVISVNSFLFQEGQKQYFCYRYSFMSDILTPLLLPPRPSQTFHHQKEREQILCATVSTFFFPFTYKISGGFRAAAIHLLLLF